MKSKGIVAALSLALLAASSGCARADAKGRGDGDGTTLESRRSSAHTFVFSGAGLNASSRVERTVQADGGELLRGSTEVTPAGAAQRLVLTERAEISAEGRLLLATAELRLGPPGGATAGTVLRSVRVDAVRGRVTVNDGGGERAFGVATGEPWIYRSLFTDLAPQASDATAVQAWVARRAGQASTRLRDIDVVAHTSHATPTDQVLFADGRSVWVVIGDEAVETDDDFVRALPWKALDAASAERRAADLRCAPGPA